MIADMQQRLRAVLIFSFCAVVLFGGDTSGAAPSSPVTYRSFNGQSYTLYPWFGKKVVLLTKSKLLDSPAIASILSALDAAFGLYEQITGSHPSRIRQTTLKGRDTIAEVPDGTTCGNACSYFGKNGTEITSSDFKLVYDGVRLRGQHDHVMFYEFGRNFWFYSKQLGAIEYFRDGFPVANRFITMDRVGIRGGPYDNGLPYPEFERSILTDLLQSYLSDAGYNWRTTLVAGKVPPNPHNWPANNLAAAMFYRIYADSGFEAYCSFWRALRRLAAAQTHEETIRNFLLAAKKATGKDYAFLFKDSDLAAAIGGQKKPPPFSVK